MVPAREREEEQGSLGDGMILRAETLRAGSAHHHLAKPKGDDRISLFWRVFGGTLLSIAALVCITIYQQFNSTLGELRTNISRLTESRGDLVKLEDFNTRTASLWTTIKDLQSANGTVSALKERSSLMEQQMKTTQEQMGARCASLAASLKDIDAANAAVLALKERSALLEQQMKASDDERKEMAREIQQLRERLAVLEGRQTVVPVPTRPTPPGRGK
jgi:hypothetical protein